MKNTILLLISTLLLSSFVAASAPESLYRIQLASFSGSVIITGITQVTGYSTTINSPSSAAYSVELLDDQSVIFRQPFTFFGDTILTVPVKPGADSVRIRDGKGFVLTSASLSGVRIIPTEIATEATPQEQNYLPIVLAAFIGFLIAAGLYMHLHPSQKKSKKR